MKTFKTFKQLKKFVINLGETLDFVNDTRYISFDITIDIEAVEKDYLECKKCKCYEYKEVIYIGKNGTGRDINWRDDYYKKLEIIVKKNEFEVSISDFNK